MSDSPFKINTNIPLWSLITVIIGGIIAVTTISVQTNANTKSIQELQGGQAELVKTLTDVRISQGRLEASVGNVLNILKN